MSQIIKSNAIELDQKNFRVFVNGQMVRITNREYDVLKILMMNKNQTVTHKMFMDDIYGSGFAPEREILKVLICNLKNKLKQHLPDVSFIETVWGRGYRIVDAA